MKINFTKKEFSALLEMIDIAGWIISSHKSQIGPAEKPYDDLEKKIYALAADFGCEDKITYSRELGDYRPTYYFDMESPHKGFIDEYDAETFWEELIDRLAMRDAIREVGEEAYRKMDPMERFSLSDKYEEKWATEFEAHGLDNLTIKS